LRKALTFGADALSIIAGGLLYAVMDHPAASIASAGLQTVIPILLVIFLLVGAVMKTYRESILDNIATSLLLSVGAFLVSLSVTALFLLLNGRQPDMSFFVKLTVYSVFFLGIDRLILYTMPRLKRTAGGEGKPPQIKAKCGYRLNEIGVKALLGRETTAPDLKGAGGYLADSTVLVAGGAGTVGFELCSQILRQNAKLVVIFDQTRTSCTKLRQS
jgi:FlaA1/EpsC-like NDP-sugar epimerase